MKQDETPNFRCLLALSVIYNGSMLFSGTRKYFMKMLCQKLRLNLKYRVLQKVS